MTWRVVKLSKDQTSSDVSRGMRMLQWVASAKARKTRRPKSGGSGSRACQRTLIPLIRDRPRTPSGGLPSGSGRTTRKRRTATPGRGRCAAAFLCDHAAFQAPWTASVDSSVPSTMLYLSTSCCVCHSRASSPARCHAAHQVYVSICDRFVQPILDSRQHKRSEEQQPASQHLAASASDGS